MRPTILAGDCLVVLDTLEENSIDAVVTDPPYGLEFMGVAWDTFYDREEGRERHYNDWGDFGSRAHPRNASEAAAIAAKKSQAFERFSRTWADKCFRVMKPGAHLVAFGAPKNYHRLACAIEDAGFEIRDSLMWVFGSGFPKSLDVSKAIDKARVEDNEPIRAICRVIRAAMDSKGLKSRHLVELFDGCHPRLIDHWAARDTDSQPSLPTWEQWLRLRDVLGIGAEHDGEVWRLNGRKGQPGDAWQEAEVVGFHEGTPGGFGDHRFYVRDNAIRAATDAARQWQGWGTSLKPAFEPVVLARKPLSEKTVAANVQRWGTGAINIDATRVGTGESRKTQTGGMGRKANPVYGAFVNAETDGFETTLGRWPANLAHDGSDEVLAGFPQNSGANGGNGKFKQHSWLGEETEQNIERDKGSAARFFYCAKASKSDRAGSKHPTVKPVSLMRWLVRMITPPGGTVLDPFAGSGTTGHAAMMEGFKAMLIEREAEYLQDIERRLTPTTLFEAAE